MGRRDLALLALIACLCADARPAAAFSAFQVKDIHPAGSSNPTDLTAVSPSLFDGAALLFAATDGTHGIELWRSDGSSGGTFMVSDILPGSASSVPAELTRVAGGLFSPGRVFFRAFEGTAGNELWKTDGTVAGTGLVKDIRPGLISSNPHTLTAVRGTGFSAGKLFFVVDDGIHGEELWKSDGTVGGTVMVKDIKAGAGGSAPSSLTDFNGRLVFSADDGLAHGRELWVSDGTDTGTYMVADLNPGQGGSHPTSLTVVGGTVFFSATAASLDWELWRSDGTSGVVQVKDIRVGSNGSYPDRFTAVNGVLFFYAQDGVTSAELYRSDGSSDGTYLVRDINPGVGHSACSQQGDHHQDMAGVLFFCANDGLHGAELWKSDGTFDGTVMVKDLRPGAEGSDPDQFTDVHGALAFTAKAPSTYPQLWRSDGRAEGTTRIPFADWQPTELTSSGAFLFFAATTGSGRELWATDLIFKGDFEAE
jgi:ELWxxDGT repeat protein